jgi:cytochrome c554/c'-like protein
MREPPARILLLALLGLTLAGAGGGSTRTDRALQQFLERHWRAPIAPQGPPPVGFGPLESSLHPDRCGICHPVQLADWKESIHAASMGPGVAGQLEELHRTDPAQARTCYVCHAPLAEQRPGAPGYDPTLTGKGIVCGSCHVRQWQRFGPPQRDGALRSSTPRARLPHNGVTRTPAFLRSEFCKDCHQFPASGYALNGKLLQDTYEEWKAGPAATSNVPCQACHMPDRRHQWRGIHDPDMVRGALTVSVSRDDTGVTLTVTNTGAGHRLPTYVTPRVVVSGELLDAEGRVVAGSRRESVIGRAVTLDLERELFDTRLPPGGSTVFRYAPERTPAPAGTLRLRVVVEPDHFYTGFFETLLQSGGGSALRGIREALEASRRSSFTVFEHRVSLD